VAEYVLPLVRGLHAGFIIALAGAWFFRAAIAPVRLGCFLPLAMTGAIVTGIGWLVVQTASFADAATPWATFAALPDVTVGTRFGHAAVTGLALLAAGWIAAGEGDRRWRNALASALALLGLLTRLSAGHAAALQNPVLSAALAVHLVAAALWLGALPPLWAAIGQETTASPRIVRRFSRIGVAAVIALAATGFVQGMVLIGDIPALLGTEYGAVTVGKTLLFMVLIGLAIGNRFVLTPSLPARVPSLRRSIVVETGIGLGVIGIAAWLGTLPPGIHIQPDWPFPFRIALRREVGDPDPAGSDIAPAFVLAALASAGLLAIVWRGRRARWVAALLVVPVWLAAVVLPRFQVLAAVPSSYRTMPGGITAAAILRGQALATRSRCVQCAALVERLTDPEQPRLTDGEVFWALRYTDAVALRDAAAWDLTAYLRAAAAGREMERDAGWSDRVPAPDLPLRCGDRLTSLSGLRGEVLRVTTGYAPPVDGARTINLDPARLADGACAALTAEGRRAYGLIAGLTRPSDIVGQWFLIDGNGWIRGTGRGLPDILTEAIRAVATTPLPEGRAHH